MPSSSSRFEASWSGSSGRSTATLFPAPCLGQTRLLRRLPKAAGEAEGGGKAKVGDRGPHPQRERRFATSSRGKENVTGQTANTSMSREVGNPTPLPRDAARKGRRATAPDRRAPLEFPVSSSSLGTASSRTSAGTSTRGNPLLQQLLPGASRRKPRRRRLRRRLPLPSLPTLDYRMAQRVTAAPRL